MMAGWKPLSGCCWLLISLVFMFWKPTNRIAPHTDNNTLHALFVLSALAGYNVDALLTIGLMQFVWGRP